ncbi:MAG: hypothetical protein FP816_17075 [Desulfobacteraceae bacterium]|nr:hypothetical protein [Desulfobacteraceae bacterium]MBU4002103.1 hypothetical protein [Pseudomonadota bacterium]MBU4055946.1 hypothetical protein [Pseudomonadota bacterium]
MSFWTAIVIIVTIGCVTEMFKTRLRARDWHTSNIAGEMEKRLERLELRMSNIETIILDKEKADRFDNLG